MASVQGITSFRANNCCDNNSKNKGTNFVKYAVIAASAGAVINSTDEFVFQRGIIKDPAGKIAQLTKDKNDFFKDIEKQCPGEIAQLKESATELFNAKVKAIKDFAAANKYDFKAIGKRALLGAGLYAGVFAAGYIIFNGIKAIFKKD